MTDFAIVRKGLHQYQVRKGEFFDLPHIEGAEGSKFEFEEVLMVTINDKTTIGQPVVEKAKVMCTILKQFRGPKHQAGKFKAKSRYRKHWGYREDLTRLQVEDIVVKK